MNRPGVRVAASAALTVIAAAAVIVTLVTLPDVHVVRATYASRTPWGPGLYVAGALAPLAAGLGWWLLRPASAVPPLLGLIATAWLAPIWVGPFGRPDVVVSLGRLLPPLLLPALLHLVTTVAWYDVQSLLLRAVLGLGWLAGLVVSLVRALFRDPFLMVDCWENCTPGSNVFLVRHVSGLVTLADQIDELAPVVMLVVAIAILGVGVPRALPSRRMLTAAVCGTGSAAMVAQAAYTVSRARMPHEVPSDPTYWSLFVARGAGLTLLGLALATAVIVATARRLRLHRLIDEVIRAQHESLRSLLARQLRDSSLQVGYWLAHDARFVDADGEPVTLNATGRVRTTVKRGGATVAVVVHEPREEPLELGPAALLAVDNERLRAEAAAHVSDLRASRARIVAAGDSSRRALERDLHDGAQQLLLAVLFELRQAAAESTAPVVQEALEETLAALADVRDLAHGIYPAILDEAGLAAALESLVDTAAAPLELDLRLARDVPPGPRAAAYVIVAAVCERGAPVRGAVERSGDVLRIELHGVADGDYLHCADRVGALGGRLEIVGDAMTAVIPCG